MYPQRAVNLGLGRLLSRVKASASSSRPASAPSFWVRRSHIGSSQASSGRSRKLGLGLASAGAAVAFSCWIIGVYLRDQDDMGNRLPSPMATRPETTRDGHSMLKTAAELQQEAQAIVEARHDVSLPRGSLKTLDADQVTEIFRKHERSYQINRGQGVVRVDTNQIPSNDPIEDDHAEAIIQVPSSQGRGLTKEWMFWGVYDGHTGWTTSAKLRQALISYVFTELDRTYRTHNLSPTAEAVDLAIKTGFTQLDHDIVWTSMDKVKRSGSKRTAAQVLSAAISGSCAILGFYDPDSQLLRVACTGDSRAVLGRRTDDGSWSARALSVDQTGDNTEEVARIRAAHPEEEKAIHNGRVMGLIQPSRAFGDGNYKWPRELSKTLRETSFARNISDTIKTPPYITAEPVITTTKIEPTKGDFVVMASDALWEMLSTEEVVGLVGKWIDDNNAKKMQTTGTRSWSWFKSGDKSVLPALPATPPQQHTETAPDRPSQWGLKSGHERFVVQDDNIATHLARNAYGGNNLDVMAGLLMLPAPNSRRFRDDLTITVVVFGGEWPVLLNSRKLANGIEPKL